MAQIQVPIRVDYYQVVTDDGEAFDFPALMERVASLSEARRSKSVFGCWVCQQSLRKANGPYEGNLIRIVMNDLPSAAKTTGATRDLDLADDEGLGNESAFIYDPRLNVLALQRNHNGVSRSGFASYYSEHDDREYRLDPVQSPFGVEVLAGLREPKKLRISFAKPNSTKVLDEMGLGIIDSMQIFKELKAVDVTIEIGVGRKRSSLSREGVIGLIRKAFDRRDAPLQVDEIFVKGENKQEEPWELDLLDYRVRDERKVAFQRFKRSRTIPLATRMQVLRHSFAAKKAEIERVLR